MRERQVRDAAARVEALWMYISLSLALFYLIPAERERDAAVKFFVLGFGNFIRVSSMTPSLKATTIYYCA